MKVKTLASGSKANCTIVSFGTTRFLIDMGISYLSLKTGLAKDSLSLNDFTGILITHTHSDHIRGLSSVIKHSKLNVYIPEDMYPEIKELVPKERIIFMSNNHVLEDTNIELIRTSHDTNSSVGYIFKYKNKKMIYVTDTGYINRKYLTKMNNADIYVIESNHDINMLMDGPYPRFLKTRILSDSGHLSNCTTARYLKKIIGDNTKYIVLAHISEKNNTETAVYNEIEKSITNKNIKIIIAKQDEESRLIEV